MATIYDVISNQVTGSRDLPSYNFPGCNLLNIKKINSITSTLPTWMVRSWPHVPAIVCLVSLVLCSLSHFFHTYVCGLVWKGLILPTYSTDTVNFIMKKFLLFSMATLMMMDQCWSQCRKANWWGSFDKEGWSKCASSVEYLKGFYRNNKNNNDPIYLLEEGRCCKAPPPNQNRASTCKNANWWGVLDKWVSSYVDYFANTTFSSYRFISRPPSDKHCSASVVPDKKMRRVM